jgi:hypothetical protein
MGARTATSPGAPEIVRIGRLDHSWASAVAFPDGMEIAVNERLRSGRAEAVYIMPNPFDFVDTHASILVCVANRPAI